MDHCWFQRAINSAYLEPDFHDAKCAFAPLHNHLYCLRRHMVHHRNPPLGKVRVLDHSIHFGPDHVRNSSGSGHPSQRDDSEKELELRENSECSDRIDKWVDQQTCAIPHGHNYQKRKAAGDV
jgi:hypothetical protein